MKFWTVQQKSVLQKIQEDGVYQANFYMDPFLQSNPLMMELYLFILETFNWNHDTEYSGLIFAFAGLDHNTIYGFDTMDEFQKYINAHSFAIKSFWKRVAKEDYVILELEYEEDLNPQYIDMNDFQLLMPPRVILPPYTEASFERIKEDLMLGQISASELQSGVIQVHLPYIKAENLKNIYPVFPLKKGLIGNILSFGR